jgi:hypothetical protein
MEAAALLLATVHARWPRRQFQFVEPIARGGGARLLDNLWRVTHTHCPPSLRASRPPEAAALLLLGTPASRWRGSRQGPLMRIRRVDATYRRFWAPLVALALLYGHTLATLTDDELHARDGPLAAVDRRPLVQLLCVRRDAPRRLALGLTGRGVSRP